MLPRLGFFLGVDCVPQRKGMTELSLQWLHYFLVFSASCVRQFQSCLSASVCSLPTCEWSSWLQMYVITHGALIA
jgi:hypothetical protein